MVGDRLAVAQTRTFDAQFFGQGVDAFGGGTLAVDLLVGVTLPMESAAQAGADAGGQGGSAAILEEILVIDGADLAGGFGEEQWAGIALALMLDQAGVAGESVTQDHWAVSSAEGRPLGRKFAVLVPAALNKGDGGKAGRIGIQ